MAMTKRPAKLKANSYLFIHWGRVTESAMARMKMLTIPIPFNHMPMHEIFLAAAYFPFLCVMCTWISKTNK